MTEPNQEPSQQPSQESKPGLRTFSAADIDKVTKEAGGSMTVAGRSVRRVAEEDAKKWAERFLKGDSIKAIAKDAGRQPAVVLKHIHKQGVDRNSRPQKPKVAKPKSSSKKIKKASTIKGMANMTKAIPLLAKPESTAAPRQVPAAKKTAGAADANKPKNLNDLLRRG